MSDNNAELIADLEVHMLGTTDGDLIDPNSDIPAGEMFRLAAEFIEARRVATPRIVPSDGLLIRALNSSNENVTYNVLADMALARGVRYDPQTGRWQPFTPTESGEQTA